MKGNYYKWIRLQLSNFDEKNLSLMCVTSSSPEDVIAEITLQMSQSCLAMVSVVTSAYRFSALITEFDHIFVIMTNLISWEYAFMNYSAFINC